ncbi:winged helix-turn-helix domain-containing protein [Sphingopyxis sp.]|uniref:winged helix-turn-helix domain-containing protein n=1 Tax=Sphingopyxis sp. TaxID=1908224 RepID=UPI003D09D545
MTDRKDAPFAFEGLDRVLHEKARLGILTSLADYRDGLSFGELRDLCGLTDGNLSRHVQTLEEAGLIEVTKGFEGRRPHTSCKLTPAGRQRFDDYLVVLEQVLLRARGDAASHIARPHKRKPI